MQLVTVYQTFSSAEANLIKSVLEAASIPVDVVHELSSIGIEGYSVASGGILVQVPEQRAAEARELIESRDRTSE